MKRKSGITLQDAIDLYNSKTYFSYISDNELEKLEIEKGYEYFIPKFRESVIGLLKRLFELDGTEKVTYINFYETNGTDIRGLRYDVVVIKYEGDELDERSK